MSQAGRFPAAMLVALAVAMASSSPRAQSNAIHTLDAIFYNFDENRDGVITSAEANHFIDKTFAEMDPRHTGRMTKKAWRNFSFGLADVAAEQGVSHSYERAKDAIFDRWDRRKKGALTLEDYRNGVLGDARAAMHGEGKGDELRIDLNAFKRARFVRQLLRSLH